MSNCALNKKKKKKKAGKMRICYGRYNFILFEKVMYLTKSITISFEKRTFLSTCATFSRNYPTSWSWLNSVTNIQFWSWILIFLCFLCPSDAKNELERLKYKPTLFLHWLDVFFLLRLLSTFCLKEYNSAASNVGCITMIAYYNKFNSYNLKMFVFSSIWTKLFRFFCRLGSCFFFQFFFSLFAFSHLFSLLLARSVVNL